MCIRDSQEIIHRVNFVWLFTMKAFRTTPKSTPPQPHIPSPALIPKSDINLYIRFLVNQCWTSFWSNQTHLHNKLAQLKSSPFPWPSSQQSSRRAEVVLTRLRIGQTRIKHFHVCVPLFPLSCPHCSCNQPISVRHMFSCPHLVPFRLKHSISDSVSYTHLTLPTIYSV